MNKISLNGIWKCVPDDGDEGVDARWFERKNRAKLPSIEIEIPNSFNTLEEFELYEGVFWHFRQFDLEGGTK